MSDLDVLKKVIGELDAIRVPVAQTEEIAIPVAEASGQLKQLYNAIVEATKKRQEMIKERTSESHPIADDVAQPDSEAPVLELVPEETETNETD